MCEQVVCEQVVCEQVVCEQVVCEQVVCEQVVCVQVVVCEHEAAGGRAADGMQNQKQEPHTKMWGIKHKKNSFTPCHLSSFSSDSLMGRSFFFGGFRGFCNCVSPTVSVAHLFFCVSCSPVSWAPGRNIHPDNHPLAQLSPPPHLY